MRYPYVCCLLFAAVLVSCTARQDAGHVSASFETFLYDSTAGYDVLIGRPAAALQLPDLRRGYDSLYVRFWYYGAFSSTAKVYCLQKKAGEPWLGRYMLFEPGDSGARLLNSGNLNDAPALWHTLDSLGILQFKGMTPDQLGRYSDGETAIVEIATAGRYVRSKSQSSLSYPGRNELPVVRQINAMLEAVFRQQR